MSEAGEHTLDTRGLLCPLPVIRTQDRIRTLTPGDVLHVLASDPGALHDIPAWCRVHGHAFLGAQSEGRIHTLTIRVQDN
jgi:tRNA 2-thiouridine synthesizing protein A